MPETVTIEIEPALIEQPDRWKEAVGRKLGRQAADIHRLELKRRSIDARKGRVRYNLKFEVHFEETRLPEAEPPFQPRAVASDPPVHIIGTGPAGLFAALRLIQSGRKPILIERGKAVRDRRRDLAALNRAGIVDPDSNYCFGEGGAGTFSDGKLYTRAKKRGAVSEVLETLVQFGADPDILIDAHPHIGTNKLPKIIQAMREAVIDCGGEVRFGTRLTDLDLQDGAIRRIQLDGELWEPVQVLVLATGHSARDVFRMLHRHQMALEAKPFALGVRIEHPQALIDQIQYSCPTGRPDYLPAAAYSLVRQVNDRGVYSFCMCPGGIICPAATAEGELVVNGWSPSLRNTGYANSGMVVELQLSDIPGVASDPLAGLAYQATVEQRAFLAGGGRQVAPAQRMADFVQGKVSNDLPECSYLPGIASQDLREVLPPFVWQRLQQGFRAFGKRMKGYLTNEAVLVAVESRTSSPIRIPRDRDSLQHPQVQGLYPCGEGAGYAGGIMSAALDGYRVAQAIAVP